MVMGSGCLCRRLVVVRRGVGEWKPLPAEGRPSRRLDRLSKIYSCGSGLHRASELGAGPLESDSFKCSSKFQTLLM